MSADAARLRLSTRLGITHGVLVALLGLLIVVTQHGLHRMLGLITEISDVRFSSLDEEEELYQASWAIEVAVRHGRNVCASDEGESVARGRIEQARNRLRSVRGPLASQASPRLGRAAEQYERLADAALAADTCKWLALRSSDERRAALDEEMTNAWIDRLHELHSDIEIKEDRARAIGSSTSSAGLTIAAFGALVAVLIAWWTARSISRPVARLAADATRLGEGNFAPIAPVDGPVEIQELQSNLERARERLAEIDRLKQAFIASVSHELRSPLARLREALSLLADGTCGPLAPKQQRVLAIGVNACEREVRIVDALLDMSRLSSGLPAKRETGCDIARVVSAAVAEEQEEAEERSVELTFLRRGNPPTLEIDSALVERAIANLVRNAVSVSEKGGLVRVEMEVLSDPRRVRILVIDQGPGLGEEIRQTLFVPFVAAAVPGRSRAAGIGLGLSFAREVARAHGGELTLARTGEDGTTFHFDLPFEIEPRSERES